MKHIVAHVAPKPQSVMHARLAWLYVFLLVAMVFGQLIAFEKFIPLIGSYDLMGGYGTTTFVAGLIVVSEVFALPYLLRMRLSHLMRWTSLICSISVAVAWVVLSLHALIVAPVENGGILGVYVNVPVGIQLVIAVCFVILSTFVASGMKPQAIKS
jgi:hypothetical protein